MGSVHRARVMNPVTAADLRRIAPAVVIGCHNVASVCGRTLPATNLFEVRVFNPNLY